MIEIVIYVFRFYSHQKNVTKYYTVQTFQGLGGRSDMCLALKNISQLFESSYGCMRKIMWK